MPQKSAFSLCTEYREKLKASETREEMAILTNQILEEYVRQVHRAQYWLTYTDKSIEEISDALGFGNRSYFSKSFRDATGVIPTDYRKQHQKV